MERLSAILQELDEAIVEENQARRNDDGLGLPLAEITIIGQFSLLNNAAITSKIELFATADVDAIVKADNYFTGSKND